MADPFLEARGLAKRFPGVRALDGVDLAVGRGETVAVIGENGAGKSTLMKILAGVQTPDAGEIRVEGRPVTVDSVRAAQALGIALIHQELNLCDNLDVASNIFLGREPTKKLFGLFPGFVDRALMDRQAAAMIDRLGAHLPAINRSVGSFSGGQQQTVAIARALTFNPKLVIMDEPTAALAVREVQSVLDLIRRLRSEGIAVILISHRLNDVLSVTDRIVVLRHGRADADLVTARTNMNEVVSRIVGGGDTSAAAAHEQRG
jgi:ABC-type sugar transport system ATPase subunit